MNPRHVPRIRGFVQHGWNYLHGFPPNDRWCTPGYPRFVWSDVLARRGWSMGRRGHYVIGSPWAYLLAMEPALGYEPQREGTIWYPFHGWEKQAVHGDHARLVDEIKRVEPGPVTVCLYWLEYRDPAVRRRYEDAGFRVICHGERGSRYDQRGRDFLRHQLVELRRHRRVASNRLTTAVLYGASVGCDVAVYGDPMTLTEERPEYGGTERRRRQWPELHGVNVDSRVAREIAAYELGFAHLTGAEELRVLFGWTADRLRGLPGPVAGPEEAAEPAVPEPRRRLAGPVRALRARRTVRTGAEAGARLGGRQAGAPAGGIAQRFRRGAGA